MEVIAITIIIAVLIIILAYLGEVLDFEWSLGDSQWVPKIKLKFRRNGSTKHNQTSADQMPSFRITEYFGNVKIAYGEKQPTLMDIDMRIKATEDDINEIYNFNSNPNTEIKRISGFIDKDSKFKKFREFSTWEGNPDQPTVDLHRITLPIPNLRKSETARLNYQLNLFGHFQEVLPGAKLASHYAAFRMPSDTKHAVLTFRIPNGHISNIFKITLLASDTNKLLAETEVELQGSRSFGLPHNYGSGWIERGKSITEVKWVIAKEMPFGTTCKLTWLTEAK